MEALGYGLDDGEGLGRLERLGSVAGCDDDGRGRLVEVELEPAEGNEGEGRAPLSWGDAERPEVAIGGRLKPPEDEVGEGPSPRKGAI